MRFWVLLFAFCMSIYWNLERKRYGLTRVDRKVYTCVIVTSPSGLGISMMSWFINKVQLSHRDKDLDHFTVPYEHIHFSFPNIFFLNRKCFKSTARRLKIYKSMIYRCKFETTKNYLKRRRKKMEQSRSDFKDK